MKQADNFGYKWGIGIRDCVDCLKITNCLSLRDFVRSRGNLQKPARHCEAIYRRGNLFLDSSAEALNNDEWVWIASAYVSQ